MKRFVEGADRGQSTPAPLFGNRPGQRRPTRHCRSGPNGVKRRNSGNAHLVMPEIKTAAYKIARKFSADLVVHIKPAIAESLESASVADINEIANSDNRGPST
jgi:hypothetical protein